MLLVYAAIGVVSFLISIKQGYALFLEKFVSRNCGRILSRRNGIPQMKLTTKD
jgi:hypothetical protein